MSRHKQAATLIPRGSRVGVDLGDGIATYTVADYRQNASGSYELELENPDAAVRRALFGANSFADRGGV